MIGSRTPGHGQSQTVDPAAAAAAKAHLELFRKLTEGEGWKNLLLPMLSAKLKELESHILDDLKLTAAEIMDLRQQRKALKDFFAGLANVTAQAGTTVQQHQASTSRPHTSDAPIPPEILKAMDAKLPEPNMGDEGVTLADLLSKQPFHPFPKS